MCISAWIGFQNRISRHPKIEPLDIRKTNLWKPKIRTLIILISITQTSHPIFGAELNQSVRSASFHPPFPLLLPLRKRYAFLADYIINDIVFQYIVSNSSKKYYVNSALACDYMIRYSHRWKRDGCLLLWGAQKAEKEPDRHLFQLFAIFNCIYPKRNCQNLAKRIDATPWECYNLWYI